MSTIQVGNLTVVGATEEQARMLKAREAFVARYCEERGLKPELMEFSQIMEMRQQEGWKNPVGVVINGK